MQKVEKVAITDEEAQKVLEKVRDVFARELHLNDEQKKGMNLDSRLSADLSADDIALMFLVIETEQELGIEIKDLDGWEEKSTLRDCCSSIARTMKKAGLL